MGNPPDSLLDRLRRVAVIILTVLATVIAILIALAQVGEALRRVLEAWRALWQS